MSIRVSLLVALVGAALAACSSSPSKTSPSADHGPGGQKNKRISEIEANHQAAQLYHLARNQLMSSEFDTALKTYDRLIERFPFTDYATQASVEKIYAEYRNYQYDQATSDADRFLREYPRHPDAPYVQYLKGLIDSAQSSSLLDYLPLGSAQRDVGSKQRAFSEFAQLIQRYPNSIYVADARKRMIALRNAIANHELEIARFYLRRGAYLAAARRAEEVIAHYPGAPATAAAMQLVERCYSVLKLNDQKRETATLIAANQGSFDAYRNPGSYAVATDVASDATAGGRPAAASKPVHKRGWLARLGAMFSWLSPTELAKEHILVGDQPAPATSAGPIRTAARDAASAPATAASADPPEAPRSVARTGQVASADHNVTTVAANDPVVSNGVRSTAAHSGTTSDSRPVSVDASHTDCGFFARIWYFVTFRSCPHSDHRQTSAAYNLLSATGDPTAARNRTR